MSAPEPDPVFCSFNTSFKIWRHIQPEGVTAADISLELRNGSGLIRLRLEFDATAHHMGSRSSTSSRDPLTPRTMSISSPSRFSLSRRRGPSPEEDD